MRNWPLFGLRLHTPRLELRLPTLADLDALGDLAAEGIHDPADMPFAVPWTDAPPAERARSTIQHHWSTWAEWTPGNWHCNFAVLMDGEIVATQGLIGRDFPILGEVSTGSWVDRSHQGKGIGTEMRTAVLELAFTGLGATRAVTSAFADNPASQSVTRKLGYEPNGTTLHPRRGKPVEEIHFTLTRPRWEQTPHTQVELTGLPPCLPHFGARTTPTTR